MLYALAIVPIFLYLGVLILLDGFSIVRRGLLLMTIICGVVCCLATYFLLQWINVRMEETIWLAPVIEEFLKGLTILVLIRMKKVVFAIDATIYGAAVGGGFALLENILYVTASNEMSIIEALFRGLGTAVMHMGLTAAVGVLLVIMTRKGSNPFFFYPIAVLPSMIFHYLFNRFLINPYLMLVVDLILLTLFFVLLFDWNRKVIYKMLDNTMINDAELLYAMEKGQFPSTPSGQYLLSMKERFRPDVFFDMICYVRLYLELSLAAKRNLMLAEVGFPIPDASEQKAQLMEFKELGKRIGKVGKLTLAPMVRGSAVETWLVDSLKH